MKNSKISYCFLGQNATTGTPNRLTGKMSMYGELVAFSCREKRDQFVNEYYDQSNPSIQAYKTNKSDAKSDYFAGLSKYVFDQYLSEVDSCVDESYNSYFDGYDDSY